MTKITIYTKTGCPWCKEVLDFLKEKKIDFQEKNVSENPDFFEQMQNISKQDKTPTLKIGDKVIADAGVEDIKDLI